MSLTHTCRSAVVAALAAGAALVAAAAANAAEVILFDGNNCSGQYRMLNSSVDNFNDIGFDNQVNSLMVITGTWTFHRDAGFGDGSGPQFQLGPSGYNQTCWSLQDASNGQFPNNRMSSAQLIQDSGEPQPTGVAILYDFTNFGGQYRVLTRDVDNFNAIGFDNDVESIRVLSGTWTFYRDAGYGEPANRPSITLAPGDYGNVANVPGYPAGTFPGDLMSSARVEAAAPPPPPEEQPLVCGAGEIAGNGQCVPCAPYNAVPNATANACVCPSGWDVVDAGAIAGVPVQLCEEASTPTPPALDCPGPYHVATADGRCVWSCSTGTQPDNVSGECVCQSGLVETGLDQFGRRQCDVPSQPPVQPVRHTAPAVQAIPAAMSAGFTMTTSVDQGGAVCQIQGDTIVFQMVNAPDDKPRTCTVTMFGGRPLATGWTFEDYNASVVYGQANPIGLTAQLPFQIQLHIPPFGDKAIVRIVSIDFIGPNGQNWQAALQ